MSGEVVKEKPTVEKNLVMLETDMIDLLYGESLGGNAGSFNFEGKKYLCGAANFFVDPSTGEIKKFGNWQDIEPEIRENYPEATLFVAFTPLSSNPFSLIIEVCYNKNSISRQSLNCVFQAVEGYNKKYSPWYKPHTTT